ncbi:hypothetical protein GCM10023340_08270 [Nocardioides marinquilinus]|uniref:DNA-binding protein n=1 Tax=Nocardioides marinquilinus TaxID=1210400 RepID=A0ABP9PGL2_9ACTN
MSAQTSTLPEREWLTVHEAAAWTGLSVSSVRRAKHAGLVRAKKTAARGGRELFAVSDLRRWINGMEDA